MKYKIEICEDLRVAHYDIKRDAISFCIQEEIEDNIFIDTNNATEHTFETIEFIVKLLEHELIHRTLLLTVSEISARSFDNIAKLTES